MPAHPRSRGENNNNLKKTGVFWGSSPLTRGKLHGGSLVRVPSGLIPAHAGKTVIGLIVMLPIWAHPRSRGENRTMRPGRCGASGSSPLTRGKLHAYELRVRTHGLIPAHAGKTRSARRRRSVTRAHPRSRGENRRKALGLSRAEGSSPLTRGKLHAYELRVRTHGLIPAHAGKTRSARRRRSVTRAHPRSRGENRRKALGLSRAEGSSPLTRGKLSLASPSSLHGRLIPAHAGKTSSCSATCRRRRAHPRSRGENTS